MNEDFGIIKNISNSFSNVFDFKKQEIIGKNCTFLMPRNIAGVHDTVLRVFIDRGYID